MIAICIDDEPILLNVLKKSIEESPDISNVYDFSSATKLIQWAKSNSFDIAFIDIELGKINGIDLAIQLKEIRPNIHIVFCTGYDNYARDAFKIHASGYLSKPIYPEDIQEQIDYIKSITPKLYNSSNKLVVKCFGNFEVFHNDKPLVFKRKKSKEIFAYLIDKEGTIVSMNELATAIWEEDMHDKNIKNYIYLLIHNLKTVLKDEGLENVLINATDGYAIDKSYVECDYYNYLEGDEKAIDSFQGKYMFQYSWAEETCGYIVDSIRR